MSTDHITTKGADLWSFYDAPHVEDLRNPLVFAAFLRSESTQTVACSSMFNTVALRATGPEGGKVTFNAVKSYLEPETLALLMDAYEEARGAGKDVTPDYRMQRVV